jgi:phenylpropionate dioxygenase-like ring-hydroxylating dioxygenase large terminal subunit
MDLDPEKLNTFIRFFQTFDPRTLQNEDDVETKFVIPMFEHLGYSSDYRRGKVAITTYNPNRSGRKPEADSVYFLTEDKEKQDENTSLLLVEAKEPKKKNLEDDVKQAKFYESYLKPPLYIVTNGIHIIVYKSHHHRSDECLFDCNVDTFKNADQATKLYKQLHFYTVKEIKQSAVDGLTNSLYVEIMQIAHIPQKG